MQMLLLVHLAVTGALLLLLSVVVVLQAGMRATRRPDVRRRPARDAAPLAPLTQGARTA